MSESRKRDHIDLAFKSRPIQKMQLGELFYEPLFSSHPSSSDEKISIEFMGHKFLGPLWISSMTGGTGIAKNINKNLALCCGEFGFGMGLGSCRSLLSEDGFSKNFNDFNVKQYMGKAPLFSNFGIAQLEQSLLDGSIDRVFEITDKLHADGLIIHVNPLQEWAQPEGDRYKKPAIETIKEVLELSQIPIIVKEVGQGFGPKSIASLCELPLAAIELAGFGGTNFTNIELNRPCPPKYQSSTRRYGQDSGKKTAINNFGQIGHDIEEMLIFIKQIDPASMKCKNFILSGGIQDPLTGFKHMMNCPYPALMGMASEFLKHAMGDYQELRNFILDINDQLAMAKSFIRRI